MKIAIVHDDLMRRGGGEQVARNFHVAFPEAPFYTSVYQPDLTYEEFRKVTITTSWYQKFVKTEEKMKRFFFPLGLLAMKQMKVEGFDVVLISTTYSGKFVKVSPNTLVITYCYTPFRLAWNPESYEEYINSRGLKKTIFDWVLRILRKVDADSSKRTNYFLAMTEETKQRIIKAYNPKDEVAIIKPPVNIENFYVSNEVKGYYLLVSRLEFYKKVDLAIDAFNILGYPLTIVGNGSKREELKARANDNIEFRQGLNSDELAKLYAECKGLIFPQYEDYGITPLEANASGRPVIAYGKGGILSTMIPVEEDAKKATALFFTEQTTDSLVEAIIRFEKLEFDEKFIRQHSEKFSEEQFAQQIKDFVNQKFAAQNKII